MSMSDLISRQAALKKLNEYMIHEPFSDDELGFNGALWCAKTAIAQMPSAEQLKFYYVESIDDYWIGMRIDNFYYADWHEGLGFVWSHSRYLPWGEHIVDENTLWKEHTYPSEPIEIPFTEWIVGFVKKYFAEPPYQYSEEYVKQIRAERDGLQELVNNMAELKTGEWIETSEGTMCRNCHKYPYDDGEYHIANWHSDFCPNCGCWMKGADDDSTL